MIMTDINITFCCGKTPQMYAIIFLLQNFKNKRLPNFHHKSAHKKI